MSSCITMAKTNTHYRSLLTTIAIAATTFVLSSRVMAIDNGLGRSVSGAQIVPYQAVVPPAPGVFIANLGAIYYPAGISGEEIFPNGGTLITNADADIMFIPLTLAYDWPGVKGAWNVLSGIVVSYVSENAEADVIGAAGNVERVYDSASGLYDLMFRVAQVSYHFSATEHMSAAFDIWAPTGDYQLGSLANLSLDNWTYVATFSYTKIFQKDFEFSGLWALEYYSPNRHSDYQSGVLSRVEVLGIKRFIPSLGVGVIGSWFQQITNDTGPLADRLNGFKGRSFGIGPIVTWSGKAGKVPVSVSARWIHEFDNKNLVQGNVYSLSVSTLF